MSSCPKKKCKWQTEPFSESTLRQLREETKVILQHSDRQRTSKDHNVPDLSNIANFEECASVDNIYGNNYNKPKAHWKKSYDEAKDVEEELRKMFESELENHNFDDPLPKKVSHKIKTLKRRNRRKLLIQLFGSPLDDILCKPKGIRMNGRRHTLPVSININKEILNPLKVTQKRKSDTVTYIPSSKIPKVVKGSSEELEPFESVAPLIVPPVFKETAKIVYSHNEFEIVFMSGPPCVETSETIANVMESPFIDLTEDGDDNPIVPQRYIKTDQEAETPCFSEQANTPVSTILGAVPGPVSPAEPTQAETVISGTAQRPPPMVKITGSDFQRSFMETASMSPNTLQNAVTPKLGEVPQRRESVTNNPQPTTSGDRTTRIRQQSGGSVTVQQQPNRATNSNQDLEEHNRIRQQFLRQNRAVLENQANQARHLWMHQNPQMFQYLPQLSRVRHEIPVMEYELINNVTCADKLFPHVYSLVEWRKLALTFYEKTKAYVARDSRIVEHKLYENCQQFTDIFGSSLIRDLSKIDVQNFNFFEILTLISKCLVTKGHTLGIYRVCNLINIMVTPMKALCTTPFLKKFYNAVKLSLARMEEKSTRVPVFTTAQLQCLEVQIRSYRLISNWLATNLGNAAHAQQPVAQAQQRAPAQQPARAQDQQPTAQTQQPARAQQPPRSKRQYTNKKNTQQAAPSINIVQNTVLRYGTTPTRPASLSLAQTVTETTQISIASLPTPTLSIEGTADGLNKQRRTSAEIAPSDLQSTSGIQPKPVQSAEVPKPIDQTTGTSNVPKPERDETPEMVIDIQADYLKPEDDIKPEIKISRDDDVIDLTWIDDVDEVEILEDIMESKSFPFKTENCDNKDSSDREVVSPTDSGVGSPKASQNDAVKYKCLCGNRAIYVCSCNSSMYCSRDCQEKDWVYHQKFCHKMQS